jgi:hypothetical protein
MEFLKSEKLCAHLKEDLQDHLNLRSSHYSECFFNKMKQILPLPGIDRWPKMTGGDMQKSKLFFLLVCVDGHHTPTLQDVSQKWVQKAKNLTLKMFLSSFTQDDHESITNTIHNFSTMAIIMC